MKTVIVTKMAIFRNSRVRPGAVIEVPDDFKASWFRLKSEAPDVPPKESKAKEPDTFSEITHGGKPKKNQFIETVI